jgi:hypothetical protein
MGAKQRVEEVLQLNDSLKRQVKLLETKLSTLGDKENLSQSPSRFFDSLGTPINVTKQLEVDNTRLKRELRNYQAVTAAALARFELHREKLDSAKPEPSTDLIEDLYDIIAKKHEGMLDQDIRQLEAASKPIFLTSPLSASSGRRE